MKTDLTVEKGNQGFRCHYFAKIGQGYRKNTNTSCFAGIVNFSNYRKYKRDELGQNIRINGSVQYTELKSLPLHIYINITNKIVSMKEVRRMVFIINKITPCEVMYINNIPFIKYKFTKNRDYKSNLLLLNFIRMTWYDASPGKTHFKNAQFFKDILEYKVTKDPLLFLTTCLKNNVINKPDNYCYGNHSIIYKGIKPRTTAEFFETAIRSCDGFVKGHDN